MDPILSSIYATVLPAAPYVIAAYILIWIIVFAYVLIVVRGLKKNDRDIDLLEDELRRIESDQRESS